MIDAPFIRRLLTWAGFAPPEEREERQKAVSSVLLNEANEAEIARISQLLDKADAENKTETEPEEEDEEEVKIYGSKRRGYMRSTKEEGTGEEIARYAAEATGTPLFSDSNASRSVAPSKDLLEKLRRYTKRDK